MDRRSFLASLLAVAAGGYGAVAASRAEAAGRAQGSCSEAAAEQPSSAILGELPVEYAQYQRRPTHWHHRDSRYRHHRRHVQRRRVCRMEHDRQGRRVQRCRWEWG